MAELPGCMFQAQGNPWVRQAGVFSIKGATGEPVSPKADAQSWSRRNPREERTNASLRQACDSLIKQTLTWRDG